jgi:hypothetical protein
MATDAHGDVHNKRLAILISARDVVRSHGYELTTVASIASIAQVASIASIARAMGIAVD